MTEQLQKTDLKNMTRDELKAFMKEMGLPAFRGEHIFTWIHGGAVSFDEMTNLSKAARAKLSERYEIGLQAYSGLQISSDGTKKYLFPVKCAHRRGLNLSCNGKYPEND